MAGRFGSGFGRKVGIAGAAALLLAAALPAAAQTVNPFGFHPGGMSTEEQNAMGSAIEQVVQAGQAGASSHWQVGNVGGTATADRLFQRDGLDCVLVTHRFDNTDRSTYSLPFCRTDEGWKIYF